MALKGRHWVAVWLLAFLGAAWVVIARQTAAIRDARALSVLRDERATLEGQRAELERRIREAEGRTELVPLARTRLGLHLPTDTEMILLPVPMPAASPH
jgi:hypothetical protein